MTFADRLRAVVAERGKLCVGVDPHAALLRDWGLDDSAAGARAFGLAVVEAAAGRVGILKPQVAFFERFGAAGFTALEAVFAAARAAGLLVIADAKRGDIGSTMDAYGVAWLSPGSPLEADALTAVAFQGLGSLDGTIDLAARSGKGVFVLAATSNPEARATQSARRQDGRTVAGAIVDDVRALGGTGGVVVGATVALDDYGLAASDLAGMPILAPGFGAQGARIADLQRIFGAAAPDVIVHVSREILSAGPAGLATAIARVAGDVEGAER